MSGANAVTSDKRQVTSRMGGGSKEGAFLEAFSDFPADAAESVAGEICAVCGCLPCYNGRQSTDRDIGDSHLFY